MKYLLLRFSLLFIILSNLIPANAQWVAQNSGTNYDLNCIKFVDNNTGWAIGNNGTILKSVDGGTIWNVQNSNTVKNLYGLSFINTQTGYIVGESFRRLKTTDGGSIWSTSDWGTTDLYSVHTFSSNNVIAVGYNLFLSTTSGFYDYTMWGSFGIQNCLFYVNSSTGWVVGNSGRVYKLTGSINFTAQTTNTLEDLKGVHFVNTSVGYIVGKNGTILKTTNGGTTWTALVSNTTIDLNSVYFTDIFTGYVVGNNETILKTTNGGTSWTVQMSSNNSTQNLKFVWFSDQNTGWIVGSNGAIYHTSNGGESPIGMASKPFGPNSRCENPSEYSTLAVNATSYLWSIEPSSSGTITGIGSNVTVTWNANYSGNTTISVKGINGTDEGPLSIPLTVYGNPSGFSLTAPTNGIWCSSSPQFQWNSSLHANYYKIFIDGTLFKDSITTTTYQLLVNENLTSGMHTWYIEASNGCTSQSNETRSFMVDATPPSTFNLTSPSDSLWTTNQQPTLEWSSSIDAHSGLAKYQLWIDGVLNRDNISITSTSTTPTSALSNGSHTWEIRAVDNVGNVRSSNQIRTVRIDNIPPGNGFSTCLYYNGTGNYIVVPDNQNVRMRLGFTIEAWIKFEPKNDGLGGRIISKQTDEWGMPGDYAISTSGPESSVKISFWISGVYNGQYVESNSYINAYNWYHIACVYNGTQMKIYINGVLDKVQSVTGTHTPTTTNLTFGRKGVGSNYLDKYKGNLDEIRFWNIERTQTQINTYKNVAIDFNSPNLVGYWRFNEGSGNTAFDHSSSHNNGTINGVTFQNSTLSASSSLCILNTPTDNPFISTTTPNFTWTSTYDAGIGFKKFQLWIDGTLVKDNLNDTTWTIINPLTYGQHSWYVKGYDSLDNNQQSSQNSFFVDNVSPNPFNLTSPTNNEIVMFPTPNLSWQSTLDSTGGAGMKKYQLWINGVVNRDSISMNTTTVTPANVLPQGAYTWFVKAYDNVNNVRQSTETRVFYVDWEAPLPFNLISPTDNQTLTMPNPTFIWHPSNDIGSGLDRYEITISGYQPIIVLPTDTTHLLTFNLPNGNYSWFVKAFDHAGAFTSSNTNSFTINVPLPEQAATPIGTNELCIGSQTTTYTTTGANYAANYVWEITPSSAGTISGTGTIGSVNWNATFSGIAQITVKGQNIVGFGLFSLPFAVTVHPATIPGTISGSSTICLGQPTGTLTLSNYSGTILKWQKRINGGAWNDINNTNTTYFETPQTIGLHEYRAVVQNEICPPLFSSIASVTVGTVPANAGTISGPTIVCSNQYGVTYSITPINDASYYEWTLPSGVSGVSTSNSINANFTTSAVSGFITVKGINDCGDGVESILAVTVNPLPADAGIISGNATVCQGETSVTYTVPTINYATAYVWTKPNGVTGTSSTNSITFNYGTTAVSGNITVKGTNSCGDGVVSTKAITVNPLPANTGTISGNATVCQGQNAVTYTVPNIANATSYLWTLPNGAIGTSTTNSITVDFNTLATSGNITVKGTNACGDGVVSTKAITVNPLPAAAGTISGSSTVCQGQNSVTYTVPSISNATSYVWTLPTGATGTSTTNSITVNYGTTAVSGNITVKGSNSCGVGVISSKAITVNPLPEPAGTISGNATVCQGENLVTYSVPDINNATSYVWTLPTGAVGTSTINSITVSYGTTALSGNITVKGTNSCGNGIISTKAITVNPLPAAAGTISGSANVCQGQSSVNYTVPSIANAISYVWTLPNGATGTSTTNSITVDFNTSATSGNITVKGTNSCGNGVIATKAITVNPLPDAAGTISGDATVCQGQNSVTYGVPTIPNATSYVWTLPTGATGTSSTNSITVSYATTAIAGNITVKGTNSCGDGVESTKAISVNPLPDAAGTISGNSTVCQGENVVTYSVPDINNATSYIWTLPTGATGTSTTNSITVSYGTSAVSGNITVKGTNSCGNGVIATKAITVNPLPAAAGTISGSANVCQGQNGVIYTVPNIANATSYVWTLPNGATGNSTTNSISVDYGVSSESGNITVKGVNACGDGTTSTKAITVHPLPDAAGIISGNATVCQGENSIVYSIPSITNAISYIWTLPNGATGTSTTNSISVNYGITAISGNISVKGSNDCGEGDISTKAITVKNRSTNTLTETVCDTYTAPDGQVYTTSGTKTAIIANAVGCDSVITINLIVNYSPVTPTIVLDFDKLISSSGSGNQWFNQNGMIPNETNQELVLTENGTYYVIVTQNDCSSDPSNSILVNDVLVQKFDKNLIVISPNPFTNQLTIKNQTSETYQYTMYNGVGQILFKGTLESEVMLNTSDLSTGLYIIKFVNSLGQVYYKVVKQ